jgi:murein DD-endopeptidase MepM/ murein hydrolase activator NlpD
MSHEGMVTRAASAIAFALIMGLVLLVTAGGMSITAQPQVLGTPTHTPTITPTLTPTSTPTPTWTASPSPTPSNTPTPTPTPTRTLTPMPTATPTPAPASAHLWLEVPIWPESEGDHLPGTFFPYGATGGGRYHLHHGVDYVNPAGTPVLAAAAGTVIVAGDELQTLYGRNPDL